jgi:hypothetical protein
MQFGIVTHSSSYALLIQMHIVELNAQLHGDDVLDAPTFLACAHCAVRQATERRLHIAKLLVRLLIQKHVKMIVCILTIF